MIRVVFICTGNICRSPMAQALLQSRWSPADGALCVSSMGIHGLEGQSASRYSITVADDNGIDLTRHRARKLSHAELDMADLILCMEPAQADYLRFAMPLLADRIGLLANWPDTRKKTTIDDPYGHSERRYKKTFSIISTHIDRLIPAIKEAFWACLLAPPTPLE